MVSVYLMIRFVAASFVFCGLKATLIFCIEFKLLTKLMAVQLQLIYNPSFPLTEKEKSLLV